MKKLRRIRSLLAVMLISLFLTGCGGTLENVYFLEGGKDPEQAFSELDWSTQDLVYFLTNENVDSLLSTYGLLPLPDPVDNVEPDDQTDTSDPGQADDQDEVECICPICNNVHTRKVDHVQDPTGEDGADQSGDGSSDQTQDGNTDPSGDDVSQGKNPADDGYFLKDGSRYAYNQLSDGEKAWYRDMEKGVSSMKEEIWLSQEGFNAGLGLDEFLKVERCVFLDHPEFFFVDTTTINYATTSGTGTEIIGIRYEPAYLYDRDTAVKRKHEIESEAGKMLSRIASSATDFQKMKLLYDAIVDHATYLMDAPDNQNIYSFFCTKQTVCQGYSKALQYLLNELGIECILIQGTGNEMTHAWNIVKLDGDYYYVDVTWANRKPHADQPDITHYYPMVDYTYFCVTTDEITRDHEIEDIVPLPVCTATKDNYFLNEGYYFTSFDSDKVKEALTNAKKENHGVVDIKCSTYDCFERIRKHLFNDGYVHQYYTFSHNMAYNYENKEYYTLTIWVTD